LKKSKRKLKKFLKPKETETKHIKTRDIAKVLLREKFIIINYTKK
jgi:hypothetical protein